MGTKIALTFVSALRRWYHVEDSWRNPWYSSECRPLWCANTGAAFFITQNSTCISASAVPILPARGEVLYTARKGRCFVYSIIAQGRSVSNKFYIKRWHYCLSDRGSFFCSFSICLMLFGGVGRSSGIVPPSSLMVWRTLRPT